jgi:hypothetical protein
VILFFFKKSKEDDLIWLVVVGVGDDGLAQCEIDTARDLGTGRTNWWRFYIGAGGSQMF